MQILIFGFSLFFLFLLIHFLIWRIRRPSGNHSIFLLGLSGLVLLGGLWSFAASFSLGEYFTLAIFYVSMTLAYIVSYSAIEVDSPSLTMILCIAGSGSAGIEKERLLDLLTDEVLIIPRIEELVADGAVRFCAGKYYLTRKGRLLSGPLVFFRKYLLKAPKGG